MEGFGGGEGSGKKTVRWSPYIEELDSSNSSSYELMPTESGSVGKEGRCASPVRDLVLDATGSSSVVPTVLSYVSSTSEKIEGELWNGDEYLYIVIIPEKYSTAMSYAVWYKKMNGDCSCQKCKRWCDIGGVKWWKDGGIV